MIKFVRRLSSVVPNSFNICASAIARSARSLANERQLKVSHHFANELCMDREPSAKVAKLSEDERGEGIAAHKPGRAKRSEDKLNDDSLAPGKVMDPVIRVMDPVIRVMQWNTLADALSTSSPTSNFIRQCSPEVLSWPKRSSRLLAKIRDSDADIVCLEEVDHYHDFFEPQLRELGYSGTFQAKPDSPCCKMAENNGPDGCALFHKAGKLSLEDEWCFVLEANGKPGNRGAVLKKLKLCSTAVNGSPQNEKCFCVAVTHLKAKPEFTELRLAEGKHLLETMEKFCRQLPCLVCGDFNAEPEEPVCKHFGISFDSVYPLDSQMFTTWKFRPSVEVCHTIDYVWYSHGDWDVEVASHLPSKETIGENGLPSLEYPSDHLPLVCSLKLL